MFLICLFAVSVFIFTACDMNIGEKTSSDDAADSSRIESASESDAQSSSAENSISGHEHEYRVAVTEPTYTEQGYTTHICNVCGVAYVSVIE